MCNVASILIGPDPMNNPSRQFEDPKKRGAASVIAPSGPAQTLEQKDLANQDVARREGVKARRLALAKGPRSLLASAGGAAGDESAPLLGRLGATPELKRTLGA